MQATSHPLVRAVRFVVWDIALDSVRMLVWWYTKGLALTASKLVRAWQEMESFIALRVWVRHLFVPMYGLRDWQSRVISIFMRFFLLIWKVFFMAVWTVLTVGVFALWVLLPPVLAWLVRWSLAAGI